VEASRAELTKRHTRLEAPSTTYKAGG
jgi:hypothetical protein